MSEFDGIFRPAVEAVLKGRELEIFKMRYGLMGNPPMTLEAIGQHYDLTRERIRQPVNRAKRKLRGQSHSQLTKGNLDHPAAQLIMHLNNILPPEGDERLDAILDLAEQAFPHLPLKETSMPLLNFLISTNQDEEEAQLIQLSRRYRERKQEARRIRTQHKQQEQLDRLLEYVVWPDTSGRWQPEQFRDHHPQDHPGSAKPAGQFTSKKLGRAVTYYSQEQGRLLRYLDASENVSYFLERPFQLPYSWNGKESSFVPHIFLLLDDGRGIVVALSSRFYMSLTENRARWKALSIHCAKKGMGLIVTNGKRSLQQMKNYPVRAEVQAQLLTLMEHDALTWDEYDKFRHAHDIPFDEFAAIILNNDVYWTLRPFSLSLTEGHNHDR